jgi:hypothetical protein
VHSQWLIGRFEGTRWFRLCHPLSHLRGTEECFSFYRKGGPSGLLQAAIKLPGQPAWACEPQAPLFTLSTLITVSFPVSVRPLVCVLTTSQAARIYQWNSDHLEAGREFRASRQYHYLPPRKSHASRRYHYLPPYWPSSGKTVRRICSGDWHLRTIRRVILAGGAGWVDPNFFKRKEYYE